MSLIHGGVVLGVGVIVGVGVGVGQIIEFEVRQSGQLENNVEPEYVP